MTCIKFLVSGGIEEIFLRAVVVILAMDTRMHVDWPHAGTAERAEVYFPCTTRQPFIVVYNVSSQSSKNN